MKKTFLTIFVGACLFGMITSCGQQPVEEKSLSSLAITKNPDKVEYNVGDAFSLSGLEVTATYSDESKEVVTNYTTSLENGYVFTLNDVGTKKVTVSYNYGEDQTKTASFSIRVSRIYEKILSSIAITALPTKVEYEEGEDLDLTGLQVTATFENNAREELGKDDVAVTGYDKNTVGEQTLTVSYTYEGVTKTTTFKVTVKAKTPTPEPVVTLKNIKIETEPKKVEYKVGEKFSSEGLTIRANYSNDTYKIVSEGFTLSPITDGAALSRPQSKLAITVTYQSKTASFNISVKSVEATITGIEVASNPTKTAYQVGEAFSSSGLKVVANKSDGTSEEITNYSLSIQEGHVFTEDEIGTDKKVTVTFYNITDE